MGKLTGTETLKNLMNCVAGEAQAAERYNRYAKYAQKGVYIQIANIFRKTASNESEHFKVYLELIVDSEEVADTPVLVESSKPYFPVNLSKTDTLVNLMAAQNSERIEQDDYLEFAKVAKEEGFEEAAEKFTLIAGIEKMHEERFTTLIQEMNEGTLFKKPEKIKWICLNCGYVCEAKEAPLICPACKHPQGYFEPLVVNY